MDVITDILIRRLITKGMETTTIPAYIRDVANTIAGNSGLSLRGLNRQVKLLGWDEIDLDAAVGLLEHDSPGSAQQFPRECLDLVTLDLIDRNLTIKEPLHELLGTDQIELVTLL